MSDQNAQGTEAQPEFPAATCSRHEHKMFGLVGHSKTPQIAHIWKCYKTGWDREELETLRKSLLANNVLDRVADLQIVPISISFTANAEDSGRLR